MITEQEKTISLVLGSGGARGLAHIGVIRELEASGFKIAAISGCSIGALVGGIYAAGKLDVFESWVSAITKMDIVTLLDLSWGRNGWSRATRSSTHSLNWSVTGRSRNCRYGSRRLPRT
jgi:NTE family protein